MMTDQHGQDGQPLPPVPPDQSRPAPDQSPAPSPWAAPAPEPPYATPAAPEPPYAVPGAEPAYVAPTAQPVWGDPGTGYVYPEPVAGQPYPAGDPGQPAPTRNRAKPYVIAGAGLLALFLLVLGGLAVWDVVREDTGVVACESLAARSGNQEQLTEAEYRELRDGFADSDFAALREHGTRALDLVWEVTRMPEGAEMNVLRLLPELSTHALGLQRACAAQGVVINLDVAD